MKTIARSRSEEVVQTLNDILALDPPTMARMLQMSARLARADDFSLLLHEILDSAIEITEADMGNIQLIDRGILRIVAQRAFEEPFLRFFNGVQPHQAVCRTALETGERIIVEDVRKSPIFADSPALEVMLAAKALALQWMPLVSRSGRVVGMFSTHYCHAPHRPSERELCMLDFLARQATDLIERKQREEATARLAAIVDSSQDAIISKDLNGVIITWNKGAERIFGYTAEEAAGQSITMLMPPDRISEEARILERLRRGERIEDYETVRRRKDGVLLDISLTISPIINEQGKIIGASKIARDISRRKRTQDELQKLNLELETRVRERTSELLSTVEESEKLHQQLLQAQKMESIGTLAGGIAHDFKNILNIIQGHLYLLREYATRDKQIGDSIAAINQTVERGSALLQQLLTIARKSSMTPEVVNANAVVERLVSFVRQSFPKTIEVATELQSDLPPIKADVNQIEQVLLNLCVNARDAMPKGGRLILRTEVVHGESIKTLGAIFQTRYICVEAKDTGTGMDEETRKRIFEPFFTTKTSDQGTGLGLPVVYGIVTSHNGFIDVESQLNIGTSFRLYFPAMA
ncbi:MAG TPA: PAS domain S-box protein [Terriglobales bacterium]|nr:PAS domain S-box protein [Terriglobales bacterium]